MNSRRILEDLSAALDRLDVALRRPDPDDLVKAGCIQYFEFSFELAWKAVGITAEAAGLSPCPSPRACFKVAFARGWIDDEDVWLEMLEARTRIANAYDAAGALAVYERLGAFLEAFQGLLDRIAPLAGPPLFPPQA